MSAPPDTLVSWPPPAVENAAPFRRHPHLASTSAIRSVMAPAPLPRRGTTAVLLTLPLRIFLAAGWLRAGVEKMISGNWWRGHALHAFIDQQHALALPFFRPVMDHAIAPVAPIVALIVMVTELACGVAIAVGRPLRAALRWGVVLNLTFIVSGVVNPSCFYLMMEIVLLFAIAEGAIGEHPTSTSRRTLLGALGVAVLGIAITPYIRTLEPSMVIHDPAIMIALTSMIVAATLLTRWVFAESRSNPAKQGVWARRLVRWASAKSADPPARRIERRVPTQS